MTLGETAATCLMGRWPAGAGGSRVEALGYVLLESQDLRGACGLPNVAVDPSRGARVHRFVCLSRADLTAVELVET